jgi:glycosyltransferase involved in cell wall biosynthesis
MDGQQGLATGDGADLQQQLRVLHVSKVQLNPYVRLLQEALSVSGVQCSTASMLSPRSERSWRGEVDIVHLHWPELLYMRPVLKKSLRLLQAVLLGLYQVKTGGCRVAYTVHNLSLHDQAFPVLHRFASAVIYRWADAVHVHDEAARDSVAATHCRRHSVHVIPHGSYVDAYPNTCTQEEARERLGLGKDRFVFLFLGLLRRYKGIDDLIAAFEQLGDTSSELMIAGRIHDPIYAGELAAHTRGKDAIHTWFEYVHDNELQYFLQACDACVLPYRKVTTSGAGVLAFSFGKPVVAPALGGLPELCADGRGFVYDAADPDGLRRALRQARLADVSQAGKSALAWAREHRWSDLAPRFVAMYRDALALGSGAP